MSLPPLQRFLGLSDSANARALLGLPDGALAATAIDEGLQRQLAVIDAHPDSRSADAHAVRQVLARAAKELREANRDEGGAVKRSPAVEKKGRDTARRRLTAAHAHAHARPRLTPFDQSVLAALIGNRGWNAAARSRIVAIASSHGLTVQGLLKVITGLSEHVKRGGPRIAVTDITSGRSRMEVPTPVAPAAAPPSSALVRTLSRQFDAERPGVRLRLSAIFGAVTILTGTLIAWMVIPRSTPTSTPPDVEPARPAVAPVDSGGAAPVIPDVDVPLIGDGTTAASAMAFARMPTFTGNALPGQAADAADQCPRLPERLDAIARQLEVSTDASLALLKDWEVSIATMSDGWALADRSTRSEVLRAVLDTLYAAGNSPQVSDRLLAEFTPPTGGLVEPLDLWRGAWRAGILGAVAGSANLPPVVVDRARSLLETVVPAARDATETTFAGSARLWLADAVPGLVQITEFDEDVYDRWELWLAAQRELGEGEEQQAAVLAAVRELLVSGSDPSEPGPTANVLGRLAGRLDLESSLVVRETLLAMWTDSRITSRDLWVLTGLLALRDKRDWFDETLVVPPDADDRLRRRLVDLLDTRWSSATPSAAGLARGRGINVDAVVLERWLAVRGLIEREPSPIAQADLLRRLVLTAELNATASLLARQRADEADRLLREMQRGLTGEDGTATPGAIPPRWRWQRANGETQAGQPMGPDGVWAESFEAARRDLDERLRLLRALRSTVGTDLGPLDADTLVDAAYRGTPPEVRSVAKAVVAEYFPRGPNVAMALLDRFPDAPRNPRQSDFLTQVTGRLLPPVRSDGWGLEARRALVEHVLSLRPRVTGAFDDMTAALARAYLQRADRGGADNRKSLPPIPEQAATRLLDRWQREAAVVMPTNPVPDDLHGLRRRLETRQRLARGPVHRFAAVQLGVLELLAYISAAEQPVLTRRIAGALMESQDRRDRMRGVLEQAVETERMMAELWAMRMVREGES